MKSFIAVTKLLAVGILWGLAYGYCTEVQQIGWVSSIIMLVPLVLLYSIISRFITFRLYKRHRWWKTCLIRIALASLAGAGFSMTYVALMHVFSREELDYVIFQYREASNPLIPRFATLGFAIFMFLGLLAYGPIAKLIKKLISWALAPALKNQETE